MNSKTKIFITFFSLSLVIIAMLGITVGVLATKSANVTSQITITYITREIKAEVSATYKRATDTAETPLTTSGGAQKIVFTGYEDNNVDNSLTADEIPLTVNNRYVTFTFTFKNTGTADFTASLTLPQLDNIDATYKLNNADIESLTNVPVSSYATVTCSLTLTIADITKDVNLDYTLTWALQSD